MVFDRPEQISLNGLSQKVIRLCALQYYATVTLHKVCFKVLLAAPSYRDLKTHDIIVKSQNHHTQNQHQPYLLAY